MPAKAVDNMVTRRDACPMSGANVPQTPTERRQRQRVPVRLQVRVDCDDGHGPREAITRDASEIGISFYCDSQIPEGRRIAFTVQVPDEVASYERIFVRGHGTVVRNEELPLGRILVAATTESYQFNE